MSDAWLLGIFGLLGAIAGGVATYLTSRASARAELERATRDHEAEIARLRISRRGQTDDAGQAAASQFLTSADVFMENARAFRYPETAANGSDVDHVRARYHESWARLIEARSLVVVLGPEELASAAEALKIAAGDHSDVIDERPGRVRWTADEDRRLEQTLQRFVEARKSYVHRTRAVFSDKSEATA